MTWIGCLIVTAGWLVFNSGWVILFGFAVMFLALGS